MKSKHEMTSYIIEASLPRRFRRIVFGVMLATFLLLSMALTQESALATLSTGYDLSWWTIDDGGGTSSGGNYALAGTSGQPDAGGMSGGGYTLIGGFWSGRRLAPSPEGNLIYLPIVFKESRS